MKSAFGVDHGEVSKAFAPVKALKLKGKKMVDNSANKNFQRGHNQQMRAHGVGGGSNITPTLGSMMPGFKRAHNAYGQGQAQGKRSVASAMDRPKSPFD